jgi:hypothetical protein
MKALRAFMGALRAKKQAGFCWMTWLAEAGARIL